MSVRFDGWDRDDYRLSPSEIEACVDHLFEDNLDGIRCGQAQVRNFAEFQRASMRDVDETLPGVIFEQKHIPTGSVGCYVTSGKYPLLASAHMFVVTAKVAGVKRIEMLAGPGNALPTPRPRALFYASLLMTRSALMLDGGGTSTS